MNTLEITKEIKQVTFKYVATGYEFTGNCNITMEKEIKDINAQIAIVSSGVATNIGSCSSNGSTSVNIYNNTYKDKIDEVAHYFKQLLEDLTTKYSASSFNDEV